MSSTYTGPQRRRYARASVDFPVTVIVPGAELVMDGNVVDIGSGGVRVVTKSDLPPGQNVMLRFNLPEAEGEVLVRARVVLSFFDASLEAYAHGTAFTQIAREAQEAIGSFIDRAEQQQAKS